MQDDIQSIDELSLENQRVFVRADFDVPVVDGKPANERRISAVVPTVKKAQSAGARVILASRLGPAGSPRAELGLEPIGARLSELLSTDIYLPDDSVGEAARKVVQDLRPGQICLLENLGFHPEEAQNDEAFARKLAAFADVYVNDAPRSLRESSASTVQLPRLLRQRGVGYTLAAELAAFARVRETERPLVAVIGGPGGASRLDWIEALLGKASTICIGGAIANTLLTASGTKMGSSPIDEQALARGRALLGRARDRGTALILPLDVAIGDRPDTSSSRVVAKGDVPNDAMALDIGPRTLEAFGRAVANAKAVLFVGALGAAENPLFATGTREVARALAESSAFSVLGGDSELPAVTGAEWIDKLSFISTGGDVSLELFVGRRLPGLEALRGGAT